MVTAQRETELEILYQEIRGDVVTASFAIAIGLFGGIVGVLGKGGPMFIIMGLVFVASGIFILMKAGSQHTVLRRNGDTTITKTHLFGSRKAVKKYAKVDITAVYYSTTYRTTRVAMSRDGSDIFLVLKDKSKVLIDRQWAYTGNFFPRRSDALSPLKPEAEQISAFLGVPLEIQDLSPLRPFPREQNDTPTDS
jgi:hypothetical protein